MSLSCKKPPFTRAMFMGRIKISLTIFEKGHQRNIPVKLFQNLTSSFGEEDFLRISSCLYIVQEAPIHQSHVFWRIKISPTIFEKSHPRNIPAKLFQNLTSGFGEEDFLRISSCSYSARGPPEPCLVKIGLAVWDEKMFKEIVDDARRTPHHPKSSP